jgi:hypothetical protein
LILPNQQHDQRQRKPPLLGGVLIDMSRLFLG